MPTLVAVPATTGPKSQETGPDVLLMELAVWAEAMCARPKTKTTVSRAIPGLEGLAANFCLFDLGEGMEGEGSVDMVSPEAWFLELAGNQQDYWQ
jgi:hypothetical protein